MEDKTLEILVQHSCFAADSIIFAPGHDSGTRADQTRKMLKAALEMLIGNGLITVTPLDEWPEYVVLVPPYKMP